LERGDPNPMQVFYNTRLALSWSNTSDDTTVAELRARADVPPRTIPDWALVVTIDTDTQHNRLEVQAHAWGPGLEQAVIDYQVFMGSPTMHPDDPQSPWARLDEYVRTPFAHASGVLIPASVYGIDSGGLNTQDVYNYGQARVRRGCVVHHGSSRPNRPIISSVPTKADIDWRGQRVNGGVLLWMIGTDVAKDHLNNRFKLAGGAGAMHFSTALDEAWYEGLLAERPVLRRKPGGGFRRAWDKVAAGARNEPLDLAVGNLALAHNLGLHKWQAQDWARLRAKLIPPTVTGDLFIAPTPPEPVDLSVVAAGVAGVAATAGTTEESSAVAAPPLVPLVFPEKQAPMPASAPMPAPVVQAAASGRRVLSRGIRR
jgi:phage terminase large subunit GpA-like protein